MRRDRGPPHLRTHRRGLSEIVGSLMLVLIVVTAAVAFGAFIATYEKQVQAEEAITHERSLENLQVLSVAPVINGSGAGWDSMNFTVASLSVDPSTITEVQVNQHPLRQYAAWTLNLTTGALQNVVVFAGGTLKVEARAQFNIIVNFSESPTSSSFYLPGPPIPLSDYVELGMFTALENSFSRTFIPPSAIGIVTTQSSWNGSGYTTIPILDGSASFQPGNDSIIAWDWSVYPDNTTATGEYAVAPFVTTTPGYVHHISLIVVNNDGFEGMDQLTYTS